MSPVSTDTWTDIDGRTHVMPGAIGIADLTDDGLTRLARTFTRAIEDGADSGTRSALLASARGQQDSRAALAARYGAVDNHVGTDSYDAHTRLGEPPTYRLAAAIDRWLCEHGRDSALDWTGR